MPVARGPFSQFFEIGNQTIRRTGCCNRSILLARFLTWHAAAPSRFSFPLGTVATESMAPKSGAYLVSSTQGNRQDRRSKVGIERLRLASISVTVRLQWIDRSGFGPRIRHTHR
jgi:hypothetical protein